jgi:ribulose-5-phosphate 4-epimerase/fuculose-1-phosphate aldolase
MIGSPSAWYANRLIGGYIMARDPVIEKKGKTAVAAPKGKRTTGHKKDDTFEPEWQRVAEDVVKAARILIKRGICEAFGHVSGRLPGSDRFIITPSLSMATVDSTEDLVQVNLKGEKVGGRNRQPYESWLHISLYRARPDVGGIVRAHSFTTSAFSVAGESVKPVHDFGSMMLGETPVFLDPRLIENEEIGTRLARFIGKGTGALLRGNGTAIVGKDVVQALVRSIYLEESAMLQLKAKQIGRPIYFTPEEVAERGTVALETPHMLRAWQHYCREAGV